MLNRIVRVVSNATGLLVRNGTDQLIGTVDEDGAPVTYGLLDEVRYSYRAGANKTRLFKKPKFEKRIIKKNDKNSDGLQAYLDSIS